MSGTKRKKVSNEDCSRVGPQKIGQMESQFQVEERAYRATVLTLHMGGGGARFYPEHLRIPRAMLEIPAIAVNDPSNKTGVGPEPEYLTPKANDYRVLVMGD